MNQIVWPIWLSLYWGKVQIMKQNFFNRIFYSIKNKLILFSISVSVISILLTFIVIFILFNNTLSQSVFENLNQYTNQFNDILESNINSIESTALRLAFDETLHNLLKEIDESAPMNEQLYLKFNINKYLTSTLINDYINTNGMLDSVFIFKNENFYMNHTTSSELSTSEIDEYQNLYKSIKNVEYKNNMYVSENQNKVFIVREIFDSNISTIHGYLIMGINISALTQNFKKESLIDFPFAVFDKNRKIIFDHKYELISKHIEIVDSNNDFPLIQEKRDNYIIYNTLDSGNFLTAVMISKNNISSVLKKTILLFYLIVLISIFFSIIGGVFISKRILNPISSLVNNINRFKNGNYTEQMSSFKEVELNQVSIVFNSMTNEINHLITEVYEKQLLISQAELASLQAQINPHFLFNVLESINWQAKISNNEIIHSMITSLASLLRANIDMHGEEKITIKEEFTYINYYLNLQKKRFEDKLSYHIDIQNPQILDLYLPKLCIQPIIENAVIHGIEKSRNPGHIHIVGKLDGEIIKFEIIDDGIGFDSEEYNYLSSYNSGNYNKEHKSIGLYNCDKRLKLKYGEQFGLSIKSTVGMGTNVTILFPVDTRKE
jgi:two-component system, sensor histidine kinase YesM